MKLTKKDTDKLWGEEGPYSEARLIVETRILDDRVSRVFLVVEVSINPFTYEFIKKNRKLFSNDPLIQQLIDHSNYRGQSFGYVSCAFQREFIDEKIMEEAKSNLEYCKKTIIKMHKFVMSLIKKKSVN
ncbi:hypothetical protein HZB96_01220 [Candidatus Gottesmanbacteria bacterium]|nr:hypothetical protein [Candidatus Gottesmanbacteria bacterium]